MATELQIVDLLVQNETIADHGRIPSIWAEAGSMNIGFLMAIFVLWMIPTAARADGGGRVGMPAFDQRAESDFVLADICGGMGLQDPVYRTLSASAAIEFFQYNGQNSSVALDNWWAQSGASLIDANLLARR